MSATPGNILCLPFGHVGLVIAAEEHITILGAPLELASPASFTNLAISTMPSWPSEHQIAASTPSQPDAKVPAASEPRSTTRSRASSKGSTSDALVSFRTSTQTSVARPLRSNSWTTNRPVRPVAPATATTRRNGCAPSCAPSAAAAAAPAPRATRPVGRTQAVGTFEQSNIAPKAMTNRGTSCQRPLPDEHCPRRVEKLQPRCIGRDSTNSQVAVRPAAQPT
mmetsp:Transcript_72038/g.206774  ORF Transcript_72038/g.206774 Transcript_72038/m.206774 type:complete len:223 (+) Transcript_72038:623-1291(+)